MFNRRYINSVCIDNLSANVLSDVHTWVLQNDAYYTTDAHLVAFISALEPVTHHMDANDETTHQIRHKINVLATNHRENNRITKSQQSTMRELRNNTYIVVLPADNERATVVMDKTDCFQKATTELAVNFVQQTTLEKPTKGYEPDFIYTNAQLDAEKEFPNFGCTCWKATFKSVSPRPTSFHRVVTKGFDLWMKRCFLKILQSIVG